MDNSWIILATSVLGSISYSGLIFSQWVNKSLFRILSSLVCSLSSSLTLTLGVSTLADMLDLEVVAGDKIGGVVSQAGCGLQDCDGLGWWVCLPFMFMSTRAEGVKLGFVYFRTFWVFLDHSKCQHTVFLLKINVQGVLWLNSILGW